MATQTHDSESERLKASPPLFESRFLDNLTRVHHLVPVVLYVPVLAACTALAFARMHVLAVLGWAAAGYALWTLMEYWLHRLVFHFAPKAGLGARLHFIIHGVHHAHPNDPKRLVMPPSASIPLAIVCFFALRTLVGATWPAVAMGLVGGYLVYDELHYHLHHHVPKTRLGKYLRRLHMLHHFQDDTRGFGITAPYWDRVFGTPLRPRDTVRRARPLEH